MKIAILQPSITKRLAQVRTDFKVWFIQHFFFFLQKMSHLTSECSDKVETWFIIIGGPYVKEILPPFQTEAGNKVPWIDTQVLQPKPTQVSFSRVRCLKMGVQSAFS